MALVLGCRYNKCMLQCFRLPFVFSTSFSPLFACSLCVCISCYQRRGEKEIEKISFIVNVMPVTNAHTKIPYTLLICTVSNNLLYQNFFSFGCITPFRPCYMLHAIVKQYSVYYLLVFAFFSGFVCFFFSFFGGINNLFRTIFFFPFF